MCSRVTCCAQDEFVSKRVRALCRCAGTSWGDRADAAAIFRAIWRDRALEHPENAERAECR